VTRVARLLHGPAPAGRRLALMYHSIEDGARRPGWQWSVSRAAFAEQCRALAGAGWRAARVCDLPAAATASDPVVYITFDDGFADNLGALEPLAEHRLVATWFVVSGALGSVCGWGGPGGEGRPLLRPEDLRALERAGMEIGSHGVSHSALTECSSTALRHELEDSKAALEDLLGREVQSFAYPYGRYDERVREAVRAAGYTRACTCRSGWVRADDGPLDIRRVAVLGDDTPARFAWKVGSGGAPFSLGRAGRTIIGRLVLGQRRGARP
jgi:peptidoglycan/xylan/chitin deacetylase (PgdA/CDA1 family)